jgi:hypothetical protein
MRPVKLGQHPKVKAGASRPGAAAKKSEKRHSAFNQGGGWFAGRDDEK